MLALLAFCVIYFASCSGLALIHAIDNQSTLTPEQISAFREMNMDTWGCFTVNGPPPNGATTWIVLPKGTDGPIFGDGCHVQTAPVVIQTDTNGGARLIAPTRR